MSLSFFPQTAEAETGQPGSSIANASAAVTQDAADSLVGEFAQRQITEEEVDRHIKSLGDLADRAYKAGDKDAARGWMTAMYAAIAGRTPAHKARIQADIDRRIDELTFDGDWAHKEGRRLA